MLLLSEPPPHFTTERVKDILGDALLDLPVKTQPVGHDGWSKDLVFMISCTEHSPLRMLAIRSARLGRFIAFRSS